MVESKHQLFSDEMLRKLPRETTVSFPVLGIPEIKTGDNIGNLIAERMVALGGVKEGDIFVVASKIVSKSEGRIVNLTQITPSDEAIQLHKRLGRKTPELIQLILDNSKSYVVQNGIILSKHKLGFEITSGGVDGLDDQTAIILPESPDSSAHAIMQEIEKKVGKHIAVVISDSEGRPDRKGAGAISIGIAGIDPLRVKEVVLEDGKIKKTEETISDMLAAQASLIMGQRGKNIPVVCIRGFSYSHNSDANLKSIIYQ